MTAALSAVFVMGCGENGTPDGGSGCTTDASCGTGKGCHPVLKTCVATCTGAVDCPSAEKTCAPINSSSASFCTCSTDALCANSVAGNICNNATKQCTAKCTANSCPSGFTCNSTSGNCTGGGTTDAGTDAGVACDDIGICSYPEVCDFTASVCKPGATCNASGVQPDTCGYAGYCTAAADCAQVLPPSCTNFSATGLPPVFNPKTDNGEIIYYVETDPAPEARVCFKGRYVHSFYINAYKDVDWPLQLAAISGAWYVDTTGNKLDLTGGVPPSYYVPNGKQMRLRKALCAKQATPFSAGFYFTGGNETCTTSAGAVAGSTSCTTNPDCGPGSTCTVATGTCN